MHLIFGFMLIVIALWCFYQVSAKRLVHTQKTQLAWMARSPLLTKLVASLCLLIALFVFAQPYGNSISIIALCIFTAPLLFAFILKVNNLKSTK
ncbi:MULTISPECIES: hypothetical protein [unclassified Acinetobacter]|uniref:hypothetical protein n=1 Tax=unclassified Acinetobacter TaxID=196816 RepID=UPI0015D10A82|nr:MULTISPECIES: hypothetical protein [unclassified Acinetobacter]